MQQIFMYFLQLYVKKAHRDNSKGASSKPIPFGVSTQKKKTAQVATTVSENAPRRNPT